MTSVIQQVTVDSNTSVVLLNTQLLADNNDIVVLLSTTTLPGRIVSIRDTTGNLSATRRIVVSTMMGTQFFGGVSSYTLTQPFSFVTVGNRDPTTWILQNTFAFPAPTTVASVLGVTAGFMIVSSIQAQTVFSTTVMQVSSLNVENVVATNDITNAGNLYVGATNARFGTKGNAIFTANVSVVSTLSTGLDVVVGRSLNVFDSMNVGGSTFIHGSLSTLGTVYARSSLTVDGPSYLSSLSTSGLVGFGSDLYMTKNTAYISSISAASLLVDRFTALSNTTLTNLSTLGPRIGFGADLYLTQNTLFDSSTFSKYVGASTIGAVSTTTSSLNVYAITTLSSVSTTGTAAFVGDVYLQNSLVGPNIVTSTLQAVNVIQTSSMFTSSLIVSGRATISSLSTFGNIGFGSDVFMTSNTLRAERVLVSSLNVSDELITRIFTAGNLTAQNTLLIGDETTAYTKITSTLVSTTQIQAVTGNIIQLVVSSIRGDGSDIYNLNAISSATLQSTLAGLGTYGYISAITANPINQGALGSTIVGLGTFGYISSFASGVINPIDIQRGVSTLNLFANNITFSNTLSSVYAGAAPNPMFAATSITGPIYAQWQSGPNNQILFGVDGTGNSIVRSQFPGSVLQPLILYGSQLTNVTSEFQVSETGPNNVPLTRIYNSNMSTGTIYADTLELNQWRGPAAGLYSTGLSTLGLFTSNTASNVSSLHAITSSGFSTLGLFTSNTASNVSSLHGIVSSGFSTLGLFTSNTASNVSSLHGIVSSGFSTLGLFTSNTASNVSSLHGITSSGFSTLGLFTSNTASNVSSLHGIVSSGFSTLGLFTSNTASNVSSLHGITSSGFSTLGLFTSNTSNFFKNTNIDWSTPLSTVALFTSNTASNVSSLHGIVSSGFSTLGLFTSNTASNVSSLHGITSSGFSTLGLFTSNTASNVSSLHGIVSSGFSTLGLFTSNTASNVSSLHGITSTGFSTLGLFTSNTSNYMFNILQNWSTPVSTATLFTSNTSNYLLNLVNNPPNTTGTVLYLNYSVTVGSYKGLQLNSSEATATNLPVSLTGSTNNIPVAQFQTDFTLPTFINSGFWDLNLFASSSHATHVSVYAILYKRNGVTETQLATSIDVPDVVGLTLAQVSPNLFIPYTDIVAGDSLVLKIFANNTGSPTETLNVYFQGATYSHIHTTLGVLVAIDVITSTTNGLGTAGYISTANFNDLSNYYYNLLQNWSTSLSTVARFGSNASNYTINTSNWAANSFQDWSTPVSTLGRFTSNSLQNWSTPVSTVALFTSNTSNYASNILQDWSTAISSIGRFTSNTGGFAAAASTDWSTAVSSVANYTSNTSNWASNILQNWSTPVSSVGTFASNASNYTVNTSNYMANILQNWSTPVSSVGTFGSNTSNYMANILQNWSTPVSSVGTFSSNASNYTVNTSNFMRGILQDWSTPVSSVGTFSSNASNYTVNTSNFMRGILQDWSTPVSTVGRFGSNTSNWASNILQDWSTPVSTVGRFGSNTSNWASNILQNWSTPVSSVGTFSSNASNYTVNTSNFMRGILQDWSTPVSSVGTFSSNASNYTVNTSNFMRGILQDWSTPVSSVGTFSSNVSNYTVNTSNFMRGILQDWSTPLSTVAAFTSNKPSGGTVDLSTMFSSLQIVTSSVGVNCNRPTYNLDVNGATKSRSLILDGPIVFNHTGGLQFWTCPPNVYQINITLLGAGGGNYEDIVFYGSAGGTLAGSLYVVPGTTYTILVGGGGWSAGAWWTGVGQGGFGGGGSSGGSAYGAGGGGRSAIYLSNAQILIAGGGGGAGSAGSFYTGGAGGGSTGGSSADGVTGGTQSAGGVGGTSGSLNTGGSSIIGAAPTRGGGGGGGYYGGGGGGYNGGGGGGSSFFTTSLLYGQNMFTVTTNTQGTAGNAGHNGGIDNHGRITITYISPYNPGTYTLMSYGTGFVTDLQAGTLGLNTFTPAYTLDVNGPSRGAIIYSTNTAASPTIYPNEYYGVYYNLTGGGGALTVNLSLTNALTTSNYGKYVVFRNNGAADATVTFAGAVSGVTPPAGTTLYSNTSMTLVVASNANTAAGSFVLF